MLLAGLAIFAIILLKTATLRQVGLLLCASVNCYLNCYLPIRHMYLMLLIFCLFLAFFLHLLPNLNVVVGVS